MAVMAVQVKDESLMRTPISAKLLWKQAKWAGTKEFFCFKTQMKYDIFLIFFRSTLSPLHTGSVNTHTRQEYTHARPLPITRTNKTNKQNKQNKQNKINSFSPSPMEHVLPTLCPFIFLVWIQIFF